MLKWSVKKRLDDQHEIYQLSDDEDESINRLYKPRRSLGDVLSEHSPNVVSPVIDQKNNKRRSLGSRLINNRIRFDKENQVLSSPIDNQLSNSINSRITSTPLNCMKLKRDQMLFKPPTSPMSYPINKSIYASTLPPFDIEYSPVIKQPKYHPIVSCEFKPEITSSTPLTTRKSIAHALLDHSTSSTFLNSSDVGDATLEKMIDAILASAKNGKKFKKTIKTKPINNNFMKTLNEVCEKSMEQKNIKSTNNDQTIIIIDNKLENLNEREVKSPIKSCDEEIELEEKCLLKRQKGVRRKNNSNENKLKKKTGEETEKIDRDIQSCSTQKCLSFSSVNDVDLSEKSKRSSVASNSSTSINSLTSLSKYTKNLLVKGSLEMTISTDENQKKIIVHVIKCENLYRKSETQQINGYVKCALVSGNPQPIQRNIFQRTAVHKNSTSPVFDHKFTFHMNSPGDYSKNIQLAVWHRNKELKTSDFLGRLTIPLKSILEQPIKGIFFLQPQRNLSKLKQEVDENVDPNAIKHLITSKTKTHSMGFKIVWTNIIKADSAKINCSAIKEFII